MFGKSRKKQAKSKNTIRKLNSYRPALEHLEERCMLSVDFQGFLDANDIIGAANLQPGSDTKEIVLINGDATPGQPAVLAIDPIAGNEVARYDHPQGTLAGWTDPGDRSLFGDVDGDGIDELVQFNRKLVSGGNLEGDAIRIVNITTGETIRSFGYNDPVIGITYQQMLMDVMDPEDVVFLGHFTQQTNLEALFFNRTTQENGSTAIRVVDLVAGHQTFASLNDGNIFSGWIDRNDEYLVSDTNFDGFDDFVLFNRVEDPTALRQTNKGFVGMVSIHPLASTPPGLHRGFYRFFDWNFAAPGENSVFPGYDELADRAVGGIVINNGRPTPVMLMVNSSSTNQAAYAVLEPRQLVEGTRDSFQLISTQPHDGQNSGAFQPNNTYIMADIDGDGTDEVVSFNRKDVESPLRVFAAFTGGTGITTENSTAGSGSTPTAQTLGSAHLVELYNDYRKQTQNNQQPPQSFYATRSNVLQFEENRVGLVIRSSNTDISTLRQQLEQLGMENIAAPPGMMGLAGFLPIDRIADLDNLTDFAGSSPLYQPVRNVGSTQWQGDGAIGGDVFRDDTGFDGSGVTVGVISDSADLVSYRGFLDGDGNIIFGLDESRATGDLPSFINDLSVNNPGDPDDDIQIFGPTDEGRAMLEIIHDIAPGASLAFHPAGSIDPISGNFGALVFAQGIYRLAFEAGADIIVDDIRYLNNPFFNDGFVSEAVDFVTDQGVLYVSAAGNQDDNAFEAPFRSAPGRVGGDIASYVDFDPGPGVDILQNFTLGRFESVTLALQWDEAFLEEGISPLPGFQVETDLDIGIFDSTGTIPLAVSVDVNSVTNQAVEVVSFTNLFGFNTDQFTIAIRHNTGPMPTRIKWINFGSDINAEYQGGTTIFGPAVANGAIAVAASPYFDPLVPEDFTSLGPAEILFDNEGNRLPVPEIRHVPLLTAPDGANTSFFPGGADVEGDGFPNFFGTSAAAPTLAAAAALILSGNPGLTRDQVVQQLIDTARDIHTPGFDNLTGFGLIQVAAAANLPPPPPPPPTPGAGNGGAPDAFEANNSSDVATNLGTLGAGANAVTGLTIHNNSDHDWFTFTVGQNSNLDVTIDLSTDSGDLDLDLYAFDGQGGLVLVDRGNTRQQSVSESVNATVAAGTQLFVRVYGFNQNRGQYTATFTV